MSECKNVRIRYMDILAGTGEAEIQPAVPANAKNALGLAPPTTRKNKVINPWKEAPVEGV
ncbi:MAG: hypothetical protein M1835_002641 [Candelina submexicana]|nr:MAG: hypothetical protein M1835_002641 [Candelina submexicana]